MSTDHEQRVSHTADKELQDIEKKYPGFIHMKLMKGIMLSFRLQQLLQKSDGNNPQHFYLSQILLALHEIPNCRRTATWVQAKGGGIAWSSQWLPLLLSPQVRHTRSAGMNQSNHLILQHQVAAPCHLDEPSEAVRRHLPQLVAHDALPGRQPGLHPLHCCR